MYLFPHLIAGRTDVSADIGSEVIAATQRNHGARSLTDDTRGRSSPAGMDHRYRRNGWPNKNHGHAVCEEQQKRDAALSGPERIRTSGGAGSSSGVSAGAGIRCSHFYDLRPVHLLGGRQTVLQRRNADRAEQPPAVLVDVGRSVADVRREIQAVIRSMAHAPAALAEGDSDSRRGEEPRVSVNGDPISLHTLEHAIPFAPEPAGSRSPRPPGHRTKLPSETDYRDRW